MKNSKKYILLFFKGVAMGGADVVPGVSGGTVAFITGIYGELLSSIKSINLQALKLLLTFRIKEFWKHINGNFLAALLSGIALSLISLAQLILYLLEVHPIQIWSFFFGLIIISAILVTKEIKKWDAGVIISGLIGIAIAYYVTVATPVDTPNYSWLIFISGAIAICAMILPGISGAFLLLIMGKYEFILDALRSLNFEVILTFILGCLVGIISFSHVITFLLKKYHNLTIALLAGFMAGSLNKIWPWKVVTAFRINSHGMEVPFLDQNVFPGTFREITGQNPLVFQALLFLLVGIGLIYFIDKIAQRYNKDLAQN